MKNYVELIGLCILSSEDYLELKMSNGDIVRVFFCEKQLTNVLDNGVYTKVIGRIAFIDCFPFSVVVAEEVYQIKGSVN